MGVYLWTDQSYYPTANTLAYFPFREDQLDTLGNYTISGTGTKQSIGYLYSEQTHLSGVTYTDQKFTSYWVKFQNGSVSSVLIACGGLRLNNRVGGNTYAEFVGKNSSNSFINMGNNGINNNTRYYVAYGWENGTYKTYVNGVLKNSGSATPSQYSESWIASAGGVILSDLIYEKSMRTADQVATYYNTTKSYYGIS